MIFRDNFYFLSNMYPCKVNYRGTEYTCAESAFQAQKCTKESEKLMFNNINGFDAKKIGRKVSLKSNWEKEKLSIMEEIVRSKFIQNPSLAEKLIGIEGVIQEDNSWGDTFWGVYNGRGENHLGKILMKIRYELKNSSLKLKETKVSYKKGMYLYNKIFIKIYSLKGSLCLIDGDIISPTEGNKMFLSYKKNEEFSFKTSEKEVEKEELISSYRKKIDPSVDYIDNYSQQKKAEEQNERLLKIISALEKL